jgi:hypothetical protein
MTTTNYFVVRPLEQPAQYVFFNDRSEDDTQRAFDEARAKSNNVAVHRPPRFAGAWDRVPVIGYRKRTDIIKDLRRTTDEVTKYWREQELEQLDALYFAAGRDTVPTTLVAA